MPMGRMHSPARLGGECIIVATVLIWLLTGAGKASCCPLCAGYNSVIHTEAQVKIQGERLAGLGVCWRYNNYLTWAMIRTFDHNHDEKLSEAEVADAQKAIEANALKNNYYFSAMINNKPATVKSFSNSSLSIRDDVAIYSFDIPLDLKLTEAVNLKIWFLDPENYYNFSLTGDKLQTQIKGDWELTYKLYPGEVLGITTRRLARTSPVTIPTETGRPEASLTEIGQGATSTSTPPPAWVKHAQKFPGIPTQEPWWRSHLNLLRKALASLQRRLNTSFQQVKAGEGPGPFLFILVFSFLYGLLHAAGPGHGKTLMASYLTAHPERFRVVVLMALGIGAVHILTGVSVAVAVYFFLNVVLPKAMAKLSLYTTKIAGVIVVLVAIYLLYTKMKQGSLHSHGHNQQSFGRLHSRAARQTNKFVVVAAGLVPCPGLVLLFLFCLALEMYLVGLLSAVAMSMGIASIQLISGSAILAARKTFLARVDKASAVLEYGAVAFIFTLGLILFFFNPTLLTPLPALKSP